jgi:Papain family cysteine protease
VRRTTLIAWLFLLFGSGDASAQTAADDVDLRHGQGLILDTEEDLAGIPRTSEYRAFLPERIDLSDRFPVPGDQGKQNSCVAWAVGYAARAYYANKVERRDLGKATNIPSPAYIYNLTMRSSGVSQCGMGSKISDALKLLRRGAVSISQFPYFEDSCQRPSDSIRSRGTDFRIAEWYVVNLDRLDQIKGQLAHGHPVIVGLQTTRDFLRLRPGEIYRSSGPFAGNHSVTVVGYDEQLQAFKVINSWGLNWADSGFGWIDYDAFRNEARVAYVMRVATTHAPEPPEPAPVVTPKPLPTPSPVVGPAPKPPPSPKPVTVPPPVKTASVILPELECARVQLVNEAHGPTVVGFVGSDEDVPRLQIALKDADVKVTVRPWPQCEALLTLDKPLSRADRPQVMIRRSQGDILAAGEKLVFEVETPPFPSYVHVAYFQADGSVLNLVQPGVGSFNAYAPQSKIVIGGGQDGGRQFTVSAPFGREMLIVIAGRSPIFSDLRPTQETERQFLTALRRALISKPNPAAPDRDVTANYDAIVTVERSAQ